MNIFDEVESQCQYSYLCVGLGNVHSGCDLRTHSGLTRGSIFYLRGVIARLVCRCDHTGHL